MIIIKNNSSTKINQRKKQTNKQKKERHGEVTVTLSASSVHM